MSSPTLTLLSLALLAVAPVQEPGPHSTALAPQEVAPALERVRAAHETPPADLFVVERVIDGDTLHIQRNGERQKLRLLSVDTEEKLSNRPDISPTKPETVFGQETMLWAQDFFAALGTEEEPAKVGLAFPGGVEEFDVYGRLLCHVVLADGTDFNLLLVREGWSPYFNKYGNSRICHEAFVAAQAEARAAKRGIWNRATNQPATPDTPTASRPYERLLPWWDARAQAIESFRAWKRKAPLDVFASEDADGLMEALARCEADPKLRVTIFGTTDRTWEEPDGGLTVLLRPANARETRRGVRAFLTNGKARTAVNDSIGLESRSEDFVQNYLYLTGHIENGPHGPRIVADDPAQWRVAGPEPVEPAEAEAVEAAGAR